MNTHSTPRSTKSSTHTKQNLTVVIWLLCVLVIYMAILFGALTFVLIFTGNESPLSLLFRVPMGLVTLIGFLLTARLAFTGVKALRSLRLDARKPHNE